MLRDKLGKKLITKPTIVEMTSCPCKDVRPIVNVACLLGKLGLWVTHQNFCHDIRFDFVDPRFQIFRPIAGLKAAFPIGLRQTSRCQSIRENYSQLRISAEVQMRQHQLKFPVFSQYHQCQ